MEPIQDNFFKRFRKKVEGIFYRTRGNKGTADLDPIIRIGRHHGGGARLSAISFGEKKASPTLRKYRQHRDRVNKLGAISRRKNRIN
jgi:hypothetical protein